MPFFGARPQRHLVTAVATLVEIAPLDLAAPIAAAARADEAFRPVPAENRRAALLLGAVQIKKPPLAEPLLKLNLVACHRNPFGKPHLFTVCSTPNQLRKVRNQVHS
jgi:hypothetical protein